MSALLALVFVCATVAEGLRAGPSAEYVVYPRLLEARGLSGEKLLHINETLTLRLEKSSILAENFVVSSLNGDEQVDTIVDGKELEKNIYHDRSQMAAVSVKEKDGSVEVSGSLGNTLRIAPLPLVGRSEDGHMAHRVFEIEDPAEFKTDYIAIRPQVQIPAEFLVEVAFIFDKHHSRHFSSEASLIEYAVLGVGMGDSFTETIEAADDLGPRTHTKKYMLSDKTLKNLAKAVQTKKVNVVADLTVLITSLDLADIESGQLSNSVLGVAYLGGLCTFHLRVAQSEDVPHTHSMVPILTHELGHSLGMVHDGDSPVYSTPGNKHRVCNPNDGFTMAPVAHGKRMGQWSPCSLDQVRGFVRTLSKACFDLLSPKRYTINMTELPGARLTKLRLCELTYPGFTGMRTYSKSENAAKCSVYCCPAEYHGRCLHVALTDGMECANGYHCLKHECVRKGTHQAPSPASPTTRPTTTTARTRRTPSTRRNWWPYWPYWPYMGRDTTSPDSKSTYQSRMDAV